MPRARTGSSLWSPGDRRPSSQGVSKLNLAQPAHPASHYVLDPRNGLGNLPGGFVFGDDAGDDAPRQIKTLALGQFHNRFCDLLRAHIENLSDVLRRGKRLRNKVAVPKAGQYERRTSLDVARDGSVSISSPDHQPLQPFVLETPESFAINSHPMLIRLAVLAAIVAVGGGRAAAQPASFAGNAQHTGQYSAPAQPLN